MTAEGDKVLLEPMQICHLTGVVEIERMVFSNPWQHGDFKSALERENAYCRIVVVDGQLLGYVIGFFINKEFHLADFSIHPNQQRKGFGQRVLDILCSELHDLSQVISLEVRMSNVAALELYKKNGFQTMAIRKNYYTHPQEDALVMLKPLHGKLSDWITEALLDTS
ncbi:MAG: ribosomal protein S18-alanine N-acetyltransferase [Candidatus Latescibacterota bacterium]|jgi:ribosomal-protein-alanine N-acetyltransferase